MYFSDIYVMLYIIYNCILFASIQKGILTLMSKTILTCVQYLQIFISITTRSNFNTHFTEILQSIQLSCEYLYKKTRAKYLYVYKYL